MGLFFPSNDKRVTWCQSTTHKKETTEITEPKKAETTRSFIVANSPNDSAWWPSKITDWVDCLLLGIIPSFFFHSVWFFQFWLVVFSNVLQREKVANLSILPALLFSFVSLNIQSFRDCHHIGRVGSLISSTNFQKRKDKLEMIFFWSIS